MKNSSIKITNYQLRFKNYSNGQLCVFIEDSNGFPMAELSIMEDNIDLQENEFIYKDYSENKEIGNELIKSNIIQPTNKLVVIGSHICPICRIQSYV